jgi:hypothetical protein
MFKGDLVNSVGGFINQDDGLIETIQYEKEWKIYRDVLNRTNVTKYTKWLDMKGNHGNNQFIFFFFEIKSFYFDK